MPRYAEDAETLIMKRSIHACLLILALAPLGFAQSTQKDERELWLVRSQNITNDLLKDATDLSSLQRAVLWAKLAQRWWREDLKRARTWIANAIEVVEQVPNNETQVEREDRLDTARVLLTILTPLDEKFTKRLMTVLTPAEKSAEPNWSSDALIDAAVAVVKDDPKRAAEIGAWALRSGAPDNLDQLLFPMRVQDPKLADSLFEQALVVVRQDPRSKLSNSLMYVAFPVQRGGSAGNATYMSEFDNLLRGSCLTTTNACSNKLSASFGSCTRIGKSSWSRLSGAPDRNAHAPISAARFGSSLTTATAASIKASELQFGSADLSAGVKTVIRRLVNFWSRGVRIVRSALAVSNLSSRSAWLSLLGTCSTTSIAFAAQVRA